MQYITKSEKETQKVAANLTNKLRGGEIILLFGNLGAGKTVFVKGLAKAFGIKNVVKSPTFNIMKCYKISTSYKLQTTSTLCHIDAYRLESLDDLLDIGVDDYIEKNSVVVIEWAERAKGVEKLGENIIKIKMEHGKGENERVINID